MPAVSATAAAIKTAAVIPPAKTAAVVVNMMTGTGTTALAPSPKACVIGTTGSRILLARATPATDCCKNKQHQHKDSQEYNGWFHAACPAESACPQRLSSRFVNRQHTR